MRVLEEKIPEVLRALIFKGGRMLRTRLAQTHRIQYKGDIDLVTEMDRAVESLFVTGVRRWFPEHEVVSEEREEGAGRNPWQSPRAGNRIRWILDPLDGTTNYAHGLPHFAISAGIEVDRHIRIGAVYNPMLDEFFLAVRGKGAWRNGRRVHVSSTRRLDRALLATGFPYDVRTSRENNFDFFKSLAVRSQAVRRAGSAALDLCDVACGRFDGFWELKLKPWDVAAGSLLVQEAGGRVTDFHGRRFDLYQGDFVASNRHLHAAVVNVLAETSARRRRRRRVGSRY